MSSCRTSTLFLMSPTLVLVSRTLHDTVYNINQRTVHPFFIAFLGVSSLDYCFTISSLVDNDS